MSKIRPITYKQYKNKAKKYRAKHLYRDLNFQRHIAKFNDKIEFKNCVAINDIINGVNSITDKEERRKYIIDKVFDSMQQMIMNAEEFMYNGARYKLDRGGVSSPIYYILKKYFY